MKTLQRFGLAVALGFTGLCVSAQTVVKEPWVRGTVAQQTATGMFAQITSATGGRLVSVSSPLAGVVEIHEMSMDGNVMKMRAVPALELPAGKTVELKPGGYHVMLMDLKQPLKAGETRPADAGGRRQGRQTGNDRRPGARQAAGSTLSRRHEALTGSRGFAPTLPLTQRGVTATQRPSTSTSCGPNCAL